MTVVVKIILSKPLVEVKSSWWSLVVAGQEVFQEDESFSLIKISTSIDVIFIPNLVYFLSDDVLIFLWTFFFDELFEESSHLLFGDHSITVDIILVEESVERSNGWCWLIVLSQEVYQEVSCLNLVEVAIIIDIVFEPNLIDLLLNPLVTSCWAKLLRFVVIHEILDESSHLLLLDLTISVLVEFLEES